MEDCEVKYQPGLWSDSDSDSLIDGVYLGEDTVEQKRPVCEAPPLVNKELVLYTAIRKADLEDVKQLMSELGGCDVDSPSFGGSTLLLRACRDGLPYIVVYLLENLKADPNIQVDSVTPLMAICDSTYADKSDVKKIVKMLLDHGAAINVSDVCYAVLNDQEDILRLLVEAGFDYTKTINRSGFSARQLAVACGFYHLLEVMPLKAESYHVPSQLLAYNSIRELIPCLFPASECPEYFQEVSSMLCAMGADECLEFFAKHHISWRKFLCLTDEDLSKIGLEFSVIRSRILHGLLKFHLYQSMRFPVKSVGRDTTETFYDLLLITANHLQNVVVLSSNVRYVKLNIENNFFGPVQKEQLSEMRKSVREYRECIKRMKDTAQYLALFSPPQNPLYIDYNEILKERKHAKMKLIGYATVVLGISAFILYKKGVFS